mgnify:CR=1 FL=1
MIIRRLLAPLHSQCLNLHDREVGLKSVPLYCVHFYYLTNIIKLLLLFQMENIDTLAVVLRNVRNIWVTLNTWSWTGTRNPIKCTCLKNCNKVSPNCKRKCEQTNIIIPQTKTQETMIIILVIFQILNSLVGQGATVTLQGTMVDRPPEMVS